LSPADGQAKALTLNLEQLFKGDLPENKKAGEGVDQRKRPIQFEHSNLVRILSRVAEGQAL